MLKTIFFDVGNVLVFFSHDKMFKQIAICCGISVEKVKEIVVKERLQDHEKGLLSSSDIYRIFQKYAAQPLTYDDLMHAASHIFIPNTDLWPVVRQLKKAGFRLIILSNISESHFHYISKNYSIIEIFDEKVLSFEVGALKPEKEIFLSALQKAHCLPQECFYTDDIPEFIHSAKQLGIDAELFTSVPLLQQALIKRGVSTPI